MGAPVKIVEILPTDFEAIIQIANSCFGKDYLTADQLSKLVEWKGVFLKALVNDKTVGFCFTLWYPENDNIDPQLIDYSGKHFVFPIGAIKTIAVEKQFQLQGIGSMLIEASIKKANKMFGATVFLYLAWTESKSFGFTAKLKKMGFEAVEIIPNYWYKESLKRNFGCLRCGNPPCNCSLTLFKVTIL